MSAHDFQTRFQSTLSRVVPRYFGSDSKVGIALTAGLDSRMVLACRPTLAQLPVCYTYGGRAGEMLDTRLAARVAHKCGMEHHILPIGSDFFSDFGNHVDRTVRATSGCFGILGAHEIYLNRQARNLAPVRLTGVCGGEILREVCTFKPIGLARDLLNPEAREAVDICTKRFVGLPQHPVSFAAFREVPWNMHGTIAACRSQVTFRTPFMDNELVALAYQAPASSRNSSTSAVRLIEEVSPELSSVPTDMGLMGANGTMTRAGMNLFAKITFKLDYLCNDGLPSRLSMLDPIIDKLNASFGVPGLHKFLWYRRWFRRELATFVRERLNDTSVTQSAFWDPRAVQQLAESHINGGRNCVHELNSVLTLSAVERLLMQKN